MHLRFSLAASLLLLAVPCLSQISNPQPPTTHSPYIIELEQKREQTLADGTHIVHTTHEKHYRDSQGHTRVDYFMNSDTGDSPRTNIIVYHSSGKVAFSWMIGDHMESTYTVDPVASFASTDVPHQSFPSTPRSPLKVERTNESLGIQDVQGFPCAATRTTIVYPVGMIGNDRPVTTTFERCMSSEFNLQLSTSSSDPRSGTMTITPVSISREEPDPSLFQPPAGFIERKVVTVPSTGTH